MSAFTGERKKLYPELDYFKFFVSLNNHAMFVVYTGLHLNANVLRILDIYLADYYYYYYYYYYYSLKI